MCTQLALPDSSSTTKDSLTESVSDAVLDNYGDATTGTLAEIDNEDELDS